MGYLIGLGLFEAGLFGSADRCDLPWFWAMIAVTTLIVAGSLPAFYLAHLLIAALDVGRFDWSGPLPAGVHAAGLMSYAAGMGVAMWAVSVNRLLPGIW